jgi:uncharacterized protein YkwD
MKVAMIGKSKYRLVLVCLFAMVFSGAGLIYGSGRDGRLSVFESGLLSQINRYRTSKGLNALSIDKTLQKLAAGHSRYMDEERSLNHDLFGDRFRKCGRTHCVENCGWNYATPEDQLKAWKSSSGHNANLINKDIRFAGISKVGAYVTFFACD